ncbi:MAG TPA: TRAP transporter substrate-binding protein DctP [Paracoccaceae bacterium]|nr:TRAP transporter substrate-binding protein DctP [Paracoccaceae bacterium]
MRRFSQAALGAAMAMLVAGGAAAAELKLSHQWSTGDMRHQVAQLLADEVAAADVDLTIKIYPSASLFKATEQYRPLSRGQLDMTVLPLSYAGGQQPAYNLTLMPGLVKSHDHWARLVESPFMDELERIMASDDVLPLVHGYLAGGFGAKGGCITAPADVAGKQIRAAGKSFEQMLAAAGASITSMASSEIYTAMQTGVLNAAMTSSESFVSYRLFEQVDCFTAPGEVALWFMYQPVLINKTTFEELTAAQREALRTASAKAQAFYLEEAKKADMAAAAAFQEAGVKVVEMTQADFDAWREVASKSSFAAFAEEAPEAVPLLDLALKVE